MNERRMPHLFGPDKSPPPTGPGDTRAPNALETRFLQQVLGVTDEVGYGPQTKEAVKTLQQQNNIVVDEQVLIGPRTWTVAMAAYRASLGGQEGPVPAVVNENAAVAVQAPITNGPEQRGPQAYARVIDQFAVDQNPRYQVRDLNHDGYDDTFCNIFLWDVTSAMGAEIPHWVGGRELNANAAVEWLANEGAANGWKPVSAEEAQSRANEGCPSVVVWHSGSSGPGHVAVIRPGVLDQDDGPTIAQAGLTNFGCGTVAQGFGRSRLGLVRYYAHP